VVSTTAGSLGPQVEPEGDESLGVAGAGQRSRGSTLREALWRGLYLFSPVIARFIRAIQTASGEGWITRMNRVMTVSVVMLSKTPRRQYGAVALASAPYAACPNFPASASAISLRVSATP
jgi:hypothetical protein